MVLFSEWKSTRRARRRVPTSGPRWVGPSATGTEWIGNSSADENFDVIVKLFKPEKFLKLLFQFVRPFSCYISDHIGPTSGQQRADIGFTSGRRGEVFQVTISLTHRHLSGRWDIPYQNADGGPTSSRRSSTSFRCRPDGAVFFGYQFLERYLAGEKIKKLEFVPK